MVHGNRIGSAVGERIAAAVQDGAVVLRAGDCDVLLRWKESRYGF